MPPQNPSRGLQEMTASSRLRFFIFLATAWSCGFSPLLRPVHADTIVTENGTYGTVNTSGGPADAFAGGTPDTTGYTNNATAFGGSGGAGAKAGAGGAAQATAQTVTSIAGSSPITAAYAKGGDGGMALGGNGGVGGAATTQAGLTTNVSLNLAQVASEARGGLGGFVNASAGGNAGDGGFATSTANIDAWPNVGTITLSNLAIGGAGGEVDAPGGKGNAGNGGDAVSFSLAAAMGNVGVSGSAGGGAGGSVDAGSGNGGDGGNATCTVAGSTASASNPQGLMSTYNSGASGGAGGSGWGVGNHGGAGGHAQVSVNVIGTGAVKLSSYVSEGGGAGGAAYHGATAGNGADVSGDGSTLGGIQASGAPSSWEFTFMEAMPARRMAPWAAPSARPAMLPSTTRNFPPPGLAVTSQPPAATAAPRDSILSPRVRVPRLAASAARAETPRPPWSWVPRAAGPSTSEMRPRAETGAASICHWA